MSIEHRGVATVFGTTGAILYRGVTLENSYIRPSMRFTDDFTMIPLRDRKNDIIGCKVSDLRGMGVIELIPISSVSSATARAAIALPPPMAMVQLFGISRTIDGFWNYIGGGDVVFSSAGHAVVTLPIARFNSDQNSQRLSRIRKIA